MNFSLVDWLVLMLTLAGIIVYGIYKSRTTPNLEGFLLGNRQLHWGVVLLSIMGTQASAITFLTAPGQAYTDGMRFVQYYFGLPIAMVVISITFVPLFQRLKLYTAYEFLEQRFDVKTRTLTSVLFLLSRGLSTGISIFAPSLVLHSMLGWDIYLTNLFMGGLLIIYTVSGGAKAVAYTQQLQFFIIYATMFIAAVWAVQALPQGVNFVDALDISGKAGKLNIITTGITEEGFNWKDRYNLWSGMIGGFFLALSYFGTDQSQVGRYLTARNERESRMSLLLNGLVKVPLQFLILLIGCLLFAYYAFYKAPVFFNAALEQQVYQSEYADAYQRVKSQYAALHTQKQQVVQQLVNNVTPLTMAQQQTLRTRLQQLETQASALRSEAKALIAKASPGADTNDTNYIFLRFVGDTLPQGLVGLIIAIIFLAAWGSIAAALHSLASCTMVDFHKRFARRVLSHREELKWSRMYTVMWGLFCIIVAQLSYNLGNSLIEAVNILGSWFYGTILGIFLVAFYLRKVQANAVFIAAVITEFIVIGIYYMDIISFLWLNVIGALGVMLLSLLFQQFMQEKAPAPTADA